MPEVVKAHQAYKQAEAEAIALRARARARLGLAVIQELDSGTTQEQIARRLGVVAEQVRRYRQGYRDWTRDHPGESP